MSEEALTDEQIRGRLAQIPGWELQGGKLARSFRFDSFVSAFGWMASVALVAESMNHHPEWRNVYASVDVALSTHDAGGVTGLDFELAERMSSLFGK